MNSVRDFELRWDTLQKEFIQETRLHFGNTLRVFLLRQFDDPLWFFVRVQFGYEALADMSPYGREEQDEP